MRLSFRLRRAAPTALAHNCLKTVAGLIAVACLLAAPAASASGVKAAAEPQPGPQPAGTRPLPSLANPASKNCGDVGGKLEIVKTDKGEIGICHFPDGSTCEEWDLLRGRCAPGENKGDGTGENGGKSGGTR